ncbi:MAG: hypothetical protein QME07_07530, partial [bacterium]|nr:hypothetical protein [bacterium]
LKGVEPLCGIYSKDIIGEIESMLAYRNLSVRALIKRVPCNYVKLEEDELFFLTNINTIEEFLKL